MNIIMKLLFIQLSAGAMIMLFYSAFRESAIEKIVNKGMDLGYSMDSKNRDDLFWFSDRLDKWSIGTVYSSGLPVLIGLFLLVYVALTILIVFTFRDLMVVVITSYLLYHVLIRAAKQNAQPLSFIMGILGLAGTIMGLFVY